MGDSTVPTLFEKDSIVCNQQMGLMSEKDFCHAVRTKKNTEYMMVDGYKLISSYIYVLSLFDNMCIL